MDASEDREPLEADGVETAVPSVPAAETDVDETAEPPLEAARKPAERGGDATAEDLSGPSGKATKKKPSVKKAVAKHPKTEVAADPEPPTPLEEAVPAPAPLEEKSKPSTRRRPIRWGRVFKVIALIIAGLLVAALGAFLVFRWCVTDDAHALEGQWQIEGTNTVITFTTDEIVLSNDLAFTYEIDPFAKTITFHFSDLDGGGHYRFSLDGNRLSIRDGAFGAWDTLLRDVPDSFGWIIDAMTGSVTPLFPEDIGVTNLVRVTADSEGQVPTPAPEAPAAETPPAPAPEPAPEAAPEAAPAPEESDTFDEPTEAPAEEEPAPAPEPMESLGQDPDTEVGAGAV